MSTQFEVTRKSVPCTAAMAMCVLNRFGGRRAAIRRKPGTATDFRRSLPEMGCLSQGLPHAHTLRACLSPKTVKHPHDTGKPIMAALTVTIRHMSPNQPGQPPKLPIPGVKNLIAVGSGKGGVGKTTVAVNLAVGLAKLGHPTGLMDADVYGPNVPLMMGINRTPMAYGERIQPLDQFGVKLMSMGFLNPGDK